MATEILSSVNGTTIPLRLIIFSWPGAVAATEGGMVFTCGGAGWFMSF